MKFGFDIDGTISALPEQLGAIMRAVLAAGHEVHVITGQTTPVTPQDRERRLAQLRDLGISESDFTRLKIAGPPDWIADKRDYCEAQGICLMFEDSAAYIAAIRTVTPCLLVQM